MSLSRSLLLCIPPPPPRAVSLNDKPVERCDELPYSDEVTILTSTIAIFSLIYQCLLVKACIESYNILKLIFKRKTIQKEETRGVSKDGSGRGGDTPRSPWSTSPVLGAISSRLGSFLRRGAGKSSNNNNDVDYEVDNNTKTNNTTTSNSNNNNNNNNNSKSEDDPTTPLINTKNSTSNDANNNNSTKSNATKHTTGDKRSRLRRRAIAAARAKRAEAAWASLSFRDRYLYIFNLWFVAATVACVSSFFYSVQVLLSSKQLLTSHPLSILLALSVSSYWFSLSQYLEYFPRFYLLIYTLKTGVPRVAQFFLGIAPFFVGYALAGMTLFGGEEVRRMR